MATQVPPKKNTAHLFDISLVSQANTKIFQANPTLATGDVLVRKDSGAFANIETLPTAVASENTVLLVSLSADEMNADRVTVVFKDAAGAEWCSLTVNIQTATRQVDDLAYPATSGRSFDVDASGRLLMQPAQPNVVIPTVTTLTNAPVDSSGVTTLLTRLSDARAGYLDVLNGVVAAIWANATRTLSAFGFTVATNSDANVTAIKAKTDNLPASPAAVGSQMDLVNAPNATAVTAIQNGLALSSTALSTAQWTNARATKLDNLDATISSRSTLGSGAITFTYTLTNADTGLPIADATIWATTDLAGNNVVASGTSNASGQVVFTLDAGTYYIWRSKSGYDFTNPDTESVA